MKVIEFLNNAELYTDRDSALVTLEERFGVKNSYNEEYDLYVLNYDQIKSAKHKFDPLVLECRSLVVEHHELAGFRVVSRSFDRFFNYGECPNEIVCSGLTAHEKMDGSLISLFQHNGQWLYRTKSMIMPTNEINGTGVTWKEVIEPLLPSEETLNKLSSLGGFDEDTYIFELIAPHNRVVVRYKEPALRLLAIRDNEIGDYALPMFVDILAEVLEVSRPKEYTFDSFEEAMEAAKDLPNLEEGFVFYDEDGVPVLKVKNPAYVAAHHLRGEGLLNAKRVCDLIIMGEMDEYLSVFPEDDQIVAPFVLGFEKIAASVSLGWMYFGEVINQKEFAMRVKDSPYAPLLFSMKKGLTYDQAWGRLTTPAKRNMIISSKESLEKLYSDFENWKNS